MVKHERPDTPLRFTGGTPSPSLSPSPSPSPAPKKARTSKPNTKAAAKPKGSSKSKGWDTEQTITLLEAVFDAASKSINKDALAAQLGVSKQSVGDQLVKNRNNLRKLAVDLVRAKKGGGA